MSRILMPYNVETADIVLGKFMDNAFQCQYEENFSKAVNLKFGPFFLVKKDGSKRMYFYCTICNKDMNSIRGLTEHSFSGNHNKNKDSDMEQKNFFPLKPTAAKIYDDPNTLQYKINKEKSTSPLVGLQRVEAYEYERGSPYYKCILCGAHGDADSMYRHLKGNRHTDKYIKTRIMLRNTSISEEERKLLRERICAKENFNLDFIRTIVGKEFYPFQWVADKEAKRTGGGGGGDRGGENRDSDRRMQIEVKKELIEDYAKKDDLRHDSPPAQQKERIDAVVKVDKGIQAYSFGFLNNVLLKFNIIVQAHINKETDLHSPEDLKVALNIMRYALHLLFYVYDRNTSVKEDEAQREAIKSCLGYIMKRIIPHFEAHYGELEY